MICDKNTLFQMGRVRMENFCMTNQIPLPTVNRLAKMDRLYHLATCGWYRPTTINIMVEKCANLGYGGPAWSWPGYVIDRTPYGVIQHELGHHVDYCKSEPAKSREDIQSLFSWKMYEAAEREAPLTNYLGKDEKAATFFMEWFAENFRLFVTNPDLSKNVRPKFHAAMLGAGLKHFSEFSWGATLDRFSAPPRIVEQARIKILVKSSEQLELS